VGERVVSRLEGADGYILHVRLLLLFCLARAQDPAPMTADGAAVAAPVAAAAGTAAAAEAPITTTDALAEGAALKLGEAARQLARTGGAIAAEGRITRMSALRSDADEVVQRARQLVSLAEQAERGE
jgi:hypothetical protein